MSIESRLERLERARDEREGRVRFRVIVPPKCSREEWERRYGGPSRDGVPSFTVRLNHHDGGEGE